MKRVTALFALLLTSSLAGGCGSSPPPPPCDPAEIIAYWTFIDASNHSTTRCSQAGVSYLRIFVNGNVQYDVNNQPNLSCAQYDAAGGAVVAAQSPRDVVEIEAYDASDTLLYASKDTLSTNQCGATTYDAHLTAQQGTLVVDLAGFGACPANSFVWYSLTDVTDPAHPFVYSAASAQTVPCVGTGAIQFDVLPFGTYVLDHVQVVQQDQSGVFGALYQNCGFGPFTHAGNDAVTVMLGDPMGQQCPR